MCKKERFLIPNTKFPSIMIVIHTIGRGFNLSFENTDESLLHKTKDEISEVIKTRNSTECSETIKMIPF